MRLETRQECVGTSPKVSGACQDDTREFAGRRLRLVGRLLRVAKKLIGRLDDAVGARRAFARTLPKVSGRSLGTCWRSLEEDRETHRWRSRRLPICGSKVNHYRPGFRVANTGKPPRADG
ncbi:hypothetical protein GW17_00035189 [Ensete ventricosum]|nr:hypothetical protein GW17_00035189 [Ensete ventricosum]